MLECREAFWADTVRQDDTFGEPPFFKLLDEITH